ncbi:hypothetical protein Y1Q_0006113 [Alligator mississippiensis]|uniref:Uncharacterized protein n=1 Tax=Alligator mississippiensis TaxID=8496 RepID=A0A151N437_ALLMI|nr:hypothetical protein Y1Q_0006113 [Alligator mississippiensis]
MACTIHRQYGGLERANYQKYENFPRSACSGGLLEHSLSLNLALLHLYTLAFRGRLKIKPREADLKPLGRRD